MKIVVLANQERQSQIFTKKHMESLRTIGEVIINEALTGRMNRSAWN